MILRFLALLFCAQLLLVLALYWPEQDTQVGRGALIPDLDADSVDTLTITDADNRSLTLSTVENRWMLASGLPADSAKVAELLDALLASDPGFAIANSESAATRFAVAGDSFERRLALSSAAGNETVYLGSSPSLGKIHARRDGEAEVYLLALNNYDAPAEPAGWLDRSLLAQRNIERLEIRGDSFELTDDDWISVAGLDFDSQAMETLLQVLGGLQVSGLADPDDPGLTDLHTVLTLTSGAASEQQTLTLLRAGEEALPEEARDGSVETGRAERYVLRSDGYEPLFTTSAYDAQRLIDAAIALTAPLADAATADQSADAEAEVSGGSDEAVLPRNQLSPR